MNPCHPIAYSIKLNMDNHNRVYHIEINEPCHPIAVVIGCDMDQRGRPYRDILILPLSSYCRGHWM